MTTFEDETLLDIDEIELDERGVRSAYAQLGDPSTAWYARKRIRSLRKAGILGAGDDKFEILHPRGPDGRWIKKFGFIRWLVDGKWQRGRVTDIDDHGNVTVQRADGDSFSFSHDDARQSLFSAPKAKASLKLPDPKSDTDVPGFEKVGSQAGSNPGALYEVTSSDAVESATTLTPGRVAVAAEAAQADGSPALTGVHNLDYSSSFSSSPDEMLAGIPIENGLLTLGGTGDVYEYRDGEWRNANTDQHVETTEMFGPKNSSRRSDVAAGSAKFYETPETQLNTFHEEYLDGQVEDPPIAGDRYYVKTAKTKSHAQNEALANDLYQLAGVPIPDVSVSRDGKMIGSKIVSGDETQVLHSVIDDPDVLAQIRKDFLIDAWVANWDTVGEGWDNVVVVDGVATRIDAGGSLLYRAQGDAKGSAFGDQVGELDTLVDPSMNSYSAKVFKGMTDADLKAGGERLAAISPQDIREAVARYDALDTKGLGDRLIARRKYILDRYGIEDPYYDKPKAGDTEEITLVPKDVVEDGGDVVDLEPTVDTASDLNTEIDIDALAEEAGLSKLELGRDAPPDLTIEDLDKMAGELPDTMNGMKWDPEQREFVNGSYTDRPLYEIELDYKDVLHEQFHNVSADLLASTMAPDANGEDQDLPPFYTTVSGRPYRIERVEDAGDWGKYLIVKSPFSGGHDRELKIPAKGTVKVTAAPETIDEMKSLWLEASEAAERDGFDADTDLFDRVDPSNPLTSITVASPVLLKEGEWVYDAPHQKWYKIKGKTGDGSSTTDNELSVVDISGDESVINLDDPATELHRPVHGSTFPSLLDSSLVRTLRAKKQKADVPGQSGDTDAGQAMAALETADVDAADVEPKHPNTPFSVNDKLMTTGEEFNPADVGDMETAEQMVGRQVLVSRGGKKQDPSDYKLSGVYDIVGAEEYTNHYDENGDYQVGEDFTRTRLKMRDAMGRTFVGGESYHSSERAYPIENVMPGIGQFTLKKDGSVVANGQKVGEWNKSYWGSFTAELYPEYSITGETVKVSPYNKSGIKGALARVMVVPGTQAVKKSPTTTSLESQIKEADITWGLPNATTPYGSAVTLADGAVVKKDMWVVSKSDGKIGQIDEIDVKGTGYVLVRMPDGTKKGRSAKSLSASQDPSGKLIPPSAPSVAHVKLADGSTPIPGGHVEQIGSTGVFGKVVAVKPDGSIRVVDGAGKGQWYKADKLEGGVKTGLEGAPASVQIAAATSSPTLIPNKKLAGNPWKPPGGEVISQTSKQLDDYRVKFPDRKLTKDGFVPTVGMRVRDSKGNQLIVTRLAKQYGGGNPSSVYVYDPKNPNVGSVARQPTGLWVDHQAELSTPDGSPLPKISSINIEGKTAGMTAPDGSQVYRINRSRVLVVRPDGHVTATGTGGAKNVNLSAMNLGTLEKIGYVDKSSDTVLTITPKSEVTWDASSIWVHKRGELDQAKLDFAAQQEAAGVVEPPTIEKLEKWNNESPFRPLPMPEEFAGDVPDSPVPVHDSTPDKLIEPARVHGSYSVDAGLQKLRDQLKSDSDVGTGTVYTMGDSDYIEDMAIRLQGAVDPTTGQEYVEVRFRLLEDKIDELSGTMLTNPQSKPGGWDPSKQVTASELVTGDRISVRLFGPVSEGEYQVKPTSSLTKGPNVTVARPPEKIGVSSNGLDAYRVVVTNNDGDTFEMVLEQRGTPSVNVFEWDPEKPVEEDPYGGGKGNWDLTVSAQSDGWTVQDRGVHYEKHKGLDDQGRRILTPEGQLVDRKLIYSGNSASGSLRAEWGDRQFGWVTVQLTSPEYGERPVRITSNSQDVPSRASVNGEVIIRVPSDDQQAALESISSLMATVGIPPEHQGQPSDNDLYKMALNKVAKQFQPGYGHMKQPDATIDDEAKAQQVLSYIEDVIRAPGYSIEQSAFGRKVRLDDIRLATHDDGRVTVVLSDEVADAIIRNSDWGYFTHNLYDADHAEFVLAGPSSTGVLSTDERWSQGIPTGGQSSEQDVQNDAGNRLYLYLRTESTIHPGYGASLMFHPRVIAKSVDYYGQSGDDYGKRDNSNRLQYTNPHGVNELMLKRKIEAEDISLVYLTSEEARDELIKKLKKRGVTHLGSRPIESVIVVKSHGASTGSLTPPNWIETPITGLLPGLPTGPVEEIPPIPGTGPETAEPASPVGAPVV